MLGLRSRTIGTLGRGRFVPEPSAAFFQAVDFPDHADEPFHGAQSFVGKRLLRFCIVLASRLARAALASVAVDLMSRLASARVIVGLIWPDERAASNASSARLG